MAIREELNQHKLHLISAQRKERVHSRVWLTTEMVSPLGHSTQTAGILGMGSKCKGGEMPFCWKPSGLSATIQLMSIWDVGRYQSDYRKPEKRIADN